MKNIIIYSALWIVSLCLVSWESVSYALHPAESLSRRAKHQPNPEAKPAHSILKASSSATDLSGVSAAHASVAGGGGAHTAVGGAPVAGLLKLQSPGGPRPEDQRPEDLAQPDKGPGKRNSIRINSAANEVIPPSPQVSGAVTPASAGDGSGAAAGSPPVSAGGGATPASGDGHL